MMIGVGDLVKCTDYFARKNHGDPTGVGEWPIYGTIMSKHIIPKTSDDGEDFVLVDVLVNGECATSNIKNWVTV